jgi:hypothetical protein
MKVTQEDAGRLQAIADRAKQMGAIHHMFLAGDGEVMAADEWESEDAFRAFYDAAGEDIGVLMGQAGVSNQPQPQFWHRLDTADRF